MKIIITGSGGDGVKYLAKKVAEKLIEKKFEVSLLLTYDAAMEGGDIFAQLVYDNKEIENPLIVKADLLVELSKVKDEFRFDKKITRGEIESKFPGDRLNEAAGKFLVEKLKL